MYYQLDVMDKKLVKLREEWVQGRKTQGNSKKCQKTAANTQAESEVISRWSLEVIALHTESPAETSTMGAVKVTGKHKRGAPARETEGEGDVLGSG